MSGDGPNPLSRMEGSGYGHIPDNGELEMSEPRYWLFKSEPSAYSFDDLVNEPDRTAEWDGVRNYQARNFMRDDMKVGDKVLFYHSSSKPTAVVGTARIVREAYPDATAWDPNDKHYDPKSSPGETVWTVVELQAGERLPNPVTLADVKANPKLKDMLLIRKGQRLSIQPVAEEEYDEIVAMGNRAR
jgi:predicted RNA-binding protein with PUA-like domain